MAQIAVLSGLQGDNSAGASAADIVINVSNPLPSPPDAIYVLYKDNNCQGISAAYNSGTGNIDVTFIQVSAGAIATADLFVQVEHSIWKGGKFLDATVNSTTNTVNPVGFTPDLVIATGGTIPGGVTWSYDPNNDTITFNGLAANNTNVRIIKLHSIQHNQNGTADGSGVLTGQNENPEILIPADGIIRDVASPTYDSNNKQITGLTANKAYVSIPVHSIFR